MACGACNKSNKSFKESISQKSKNLKKEDPDRNRSDVRKIAQQYYNPRNDGNYYLTRKDDSQLTEKQKRIKYRIKRLERRSIDRALNEYKKTK